MKSNSALALLTLLGSNCKTISVKFKDSAGNAFGQAYTYKVPADLELKVEDEVIVNSPHGGMCAVVVTDIHAVADIDIAAPFKYTWIVAKIDTTAYDACLAKDAKIVDKVEELQRKAQQATAVATLMKDLDLDQDGLAALLKDLA